MCIPAVCQGEVRLETAEDTELQHPAEKAFV